jgi:polyisoprenoid-binding protein YceI
MSTIPGYKAGSWTIDAVHSDVSFSVRHMMVSKVKGRFGAFEGTITTGEEPKDSSVSVSIDLTSIDTNNAQRDGHIKSADFFSVEEHQTITFASTSVTPKGDEWLLTGDLTIRGTTKQVEMKLEANGFGPDAYGGTRAGFTATTEINRKDFGVNFNATMETGGAIVSDKVTIQLEIEVVLRAA